MASGPITYWKIDGETMETVREFIFLASKITAGGDFSHEIKMCLLLGKKAMTNLDSPEEWYGEGGGRRVQDGEHMYICGGFILIYGKTNTIL